MRNVRIIILIVRILIATLATILISPCLESKHAEFVTASAHGGMTLLPIHEEIRRHQANELKNTLVLISALIRVYTSATLFSSYPSAKHTPPASPPKPTESN